MGYELAKVLGERVIIVAGSWFAGLAEASPVIGYHTIARSEEQGGPVSPRKSRLTVSVDKNNRTTRAVIFIIEIDTVGVFLTYTNVWQENLLSRFG